MFNTARLGIVGALALAAIFGCKPRPTALNPEKNALTAASAQRVPAPASVPAPFHAGSAEHGKALIAELECNRCHSGTGLAAPKLERDCVGCHEQIATDKFVAKPGKLAEWKEHVAPYRDVPSLGELGARLRPAWVRDYLLHPHDLRPNLAQTMPRLQVSVEQATDIATYLTSFGSPPTEMLGVQAEPTQVRHGKQLLVERGCIGCHQISGAGLGAPATNSPPQRSLGLAPDLRFVRERSEPESIARWILDPTRVKADAAMPKLGVSANDARDLAAFLSFGELAPVPPKPPLVRLPLLARRVGFDEVNQRVFAVTCRHCHTNPDLADGDGGPGSTGGFGFKPRRIDFSSYQGIQSGGLDSRGERVSLFAPTSEGLPRLVAALVARAREDGGQESNEVRGMPLGLPPLSADEIQLVESWVAQGRPL